MKSAAETAGTHPSSQEPDLESVTRFPSDRNRAIGLRLLAAGIPATALLAGVAWFIGFSFFWDWAFFAMIWAAVSYGVMSVPARLRRSGQTLAIKDGLFLPLRELSLDGVCEIELDEIEEKGECSMWHVHLRCGDRLEEVARKRDGQLAMRNLAEWLCKATGLPMVDASSDPVVRLEAEALDLPFRSRARKYPSLDIRRDPASRSFGIHIEAHGQQATRFYWHYLNRRTWKAAGLLTAFLLLVYLVPEQGGSFYDAYGWRGLVGALAPGALLIVLTRFMRTRLVLSPARVCLDSTLFRLPLSRRWLAGSEIEDVRVIHRVVAVASDRKVLRFRTFLSEQADDANARWLADEIREYLMGREDPSQPHVADAAGVPDPEQAARRP